MASETVTSRQETNRTIITVDRPEKRNAMDIETRNALGDAFRAAEQNEEIKAIILRGAGGTFISGSDITIFQDMSYQQAKEYTQYTQGLYNYVESISMPVIAAIEGYAMGGGLEIAMCCDLRVATEGAKLGQSEINIGAIPGGGGTQRLPRLVGMGNAKELMYTGQPIDAERAQQMGLVNRIVPDGELLNAANQLCTQILEHSPTVLSILKEVIDKGSKMDLHAGLELERYAWASVFTTEDVAEGVDAFLSGEDPAYGGRTYSHLE